MLPVYRCCQRRPWFMAIILTVVMVVGWQWVNMKSEFHRDHVPGVGTDARGHKIALSSSATINDEELDPDNSETFPVIAILIPLTGELASHIITMRSPCIESLHATVEDMYMYNVYIGINSTNHESESMSILQSSINIRFILVKVTANTLAESVHALANIAHSENTDYYMHIDDDTVFKSKQWTTSAVQALSRKVPANIGVVVADCPRQYNSLVVPMFVHRTHLDIFGYFYPPQYGHDASVWIRQIYAPHRRTTLTPGDCKWNETVHLSTYLSNELHTNIVTRCKTQISVFINEMYDDTQINVIAFTLYGSNPRYIDGAIPNAILMSHVYPGWTMRVYHDNTVPDYILTGLRHRNVKLVDMTNSSIRCKRTWRFIVASDPSVRRYILRDVDSRLSMREKAAVGEWMASEKQFHIMRDHWLHRSNLVLAGMWGGLHTSMPDMESRLINAVLNNTVKSSDQDFLRLHILPLAPELAMMHDSFYCDKSKGARPFPTVRLNDEHVGSIFVRGQQKTRVKRKPPRQCIHDVAIQSSIIT